MRLKSRPKEPSPSLTRVGANFYSSVKQQDYSASVWLRRKDKLEHVSAARSPDRGPAPATRAPRGRARGPRRRPGLGPGRPGPTPARGLSSTFLPGRSGLRGGEERGGEERGGEGRGGVVPFRTAWPSTPRPPRASTAGGHSQCVCGVSKKGNCPSVAPRSRRCTVVGFRGAFARVFGAILPGPELTLTNP